MCGVLINISGKTNSGKTTLALTMAKNAADSGLLLAIFDEADRMGETLKPVVERLLKQGTHVVTITHGPSVQPVVSIKGQSDDFLMRALFGDGLVGFKVFAKSDCGHLADVSPDEAESILSNTSCRASFLGFRDADWQSAPGKSENSRSRSRSFLDPSTRLFEAGYVPGMEYRHAVEMGKWHPDMERFLADLPGRVGESGHQEAFERAKAFVALRLACSGKKPRHAACEGAAWMAGGDALLHNIVLGTTADGMKDPYLAFTQDLHELLVKHADVVNAPTGRGDGVQIAVSRKVVETLSQHGDTSSYINNLRRFDVNQRT